MDPVAIHDQYRDRAGQPYGVRDAEAGDASALIDLINQVGQEEIFIADERAMVTLEQQQAVIQHHDPAIQLILVACRNHHILGSLEMVRGTLRKNRHTAIFGMALSAEFRGFGIGRGLLSSGERWAKALGVEKISLAVFATNMRAIRLYQSLGYREEARRYGQYRLEGQLVDEIWMARWL